MKTVGFASFKFTASLGSHSSKLEIYDRDYIRVCMCLLKETVFCVSGNKKDVLSIKCFVCVCLCSASVCCIYYDETSVSVRGGRSFNYNKAFVVCQYPHNIGFFVIIVLYWFNRFCKKTSNILERNSKV